MYSLHNFVFLLLLCNTKTFVQYDLMFSSFIEEKEVDIIMVAELWLSFPVV